MKTHKLKKAKTSKALGLWYDQKYTEMGKGWDCPQEAAKEYFKFMQLPNYNKYYLLDVGCGDGDFIKRVREFNSHIDCTGVDLSVVAIKKAKIKNPDCFFAVSDIEKLITTISYDYITSIGSIEHCINIKKALKNIRTLLKNEGVFYALVPNEEWQHFDQVNETTQTDEEWEKLFKDSGFRVVRQMRIRDISHFLMKKKI